MRTRAIRIALVIPALACLSLGALASVERSPELVLQHLHPRNESFSFSRAGLIAITDNRGAVDIWHTRTWTLLRTLRVHEPVDIVTSITADIALSPDGSTLAHLGLKGDPAELWDVRTGVRRAALPTRGRWPTSVQWSPDGKTLAVAGQKAVELWDVRTLRSVATIPEGGDVTFSKDGKTVGVASQSGAFLFDAASGKKLREFKDESGAFDPIAISPDGRLVATGGEDPNWEYSGVAALESESAHGLKVKVWNAKTGKLMRILPGHYSDAGGTQSLQFAPDSRTLFSGGSGYAALWDTRTGRAIRTLKSSDAGVMSPEGKMVVLSAWSHTAGSTVTVASARTGRQIASLTRRTRRIEALAFSPDSRLLGSVEQYMSCDVRVWDVESGRMVHALGDAPVQSAKPVFADGGRILLAGYAWDLASGLLLRKLEPPAEADAPMEPPWAQKSLLLGTHQGLLLAEKSGNCYKLAGPIWDSATNKLMRPIPRGASAPYLSAWTSDARLLTVQVASGSETNWPDSVAICDLGTGKLLSRLERAKDIPIGMVFSADGKSLAGSVYKQGLLVWDTATGAVKQKIELKTDSELAPSIALSPDCSVLAAALPAEVRLFDVKTGGGIGSVKSKEATISAVAFSPDGRLIAVGDEAGWIRVWRVSDLSLLLSVIGFTQPGGKSVSSDWLSRRPDGTCDYSPGAAKLIRWRIDGKLQPARAFGRIRK